MKRWYLFSGLAFFLLAILPVRAQEQKPWYDKIKPNADLRYRHEEIDKEDVYWRTRDRIRARLGFKASINPAWDMYVQLATDEPSKDSGKGSKRGGDPTSTNQTLTDSESKKPIWLDLAYLDFHPQQLQGFHLYGGKMKNPFFIPGKNQLIWDSDLTPEGGAISYAYSSEPVEPFLNVADFWIEEREADEDSALYGGQGGLRVKFPNSKIYLILAGAYFEYVKTKDYTPTGGFGSDPSKSYGNTMSGGVYVNDYKLAEAGLELGVDVHGYPLVLYGDYVVNNGISHDDPGDKDNIGWLAGVNFGKAQKAMTFGLRYNYRVLERDAVIGAFSDSDFIGGGTDGKGHCFGVDFAPFDNVVISFTDFINTGAISHDNAKTFDYNRMQFDVVVTF